MLVTTGGGALWVEATQAPRPVVAGKTRPAAKGLAITTTGATPENAFRMMFREHHQSVLAYARRRVDCDSDAQDVAAETFLRAWRGFETARSRGLPWLIGIARNVLKEHYRGRERQVAVAQAMRARTTDVTGRDHADCDISTVFDALCALSERDREVLTLHAWEGFDPARIAAVLGCSIANARLRLHRARKRLQIELEARQ